MEKNAYYVDDVDYKEPFDENSLGHRFLKHCIDDGKIKCIENILDDIKNKVLNIFTDELVELNSEQLQYIKFLNKMFNELRNRQVCIEENMHNDGEMRMEDYYAFMSHIDEFSLKDK